MYLIRNFALQQATTATDIFLLVTSYCKLSFMSKESGILLLWVHPILGVSCMFDLSLSIKGCVHRGGERKPYFYTIGSLHLILFFLWSLILYAKFHVMKNRRMDPKETDAIASSSSKQGHNSETINLNLACLLWSLILCIEFQMICYKWSSENLKKKWNFCANQGA